MKRIILSFIGVALLAGLIFAFLSGRKEQAAETEGEKPVEAPTRIEVINGENILAVDAAARTSSGIKLGMLPSASQRPQVCAFGSVIDPGELNDLHRTFVQAQAEVEKSQASFDVAQQEYDRLKGLFESNQNVAQRAVQSAAGSARAEAANLKVAEAAIAAVRTAAAQRWGRVIADWVTKDGSEFQRLQQQDALLVQVTLSPSQNAIDAPANAFVQTGETQLLPATLVSPAARADPKLQGRSYFYLVATAAGNLLPGMNVTMLMPVGDSSPRVIVPRSAVIWLQGKPWVYVQLKPDRFARREVSTAQPAPDGWFQSANFAGAHDVVIAGAQILLSEEFRAQIAVDN
ncbi:MAG: hypothetical protein ABI273_17690 [Lacunisphaera sp.]